MVTVLIFKLRVVGLWYAFIAYHNEMIGVEKSLNWIEKSCTQYSGMLSLALQSLSLSCKLHLCALFHFRFMVGKVSIIIGKFTLVVTLNR